MIACSDVIYRAGILLNDIEHVTYTVDELVAWCNDGAAAILRVRPPAGSVTENLLLQEGAHQKPSGNVVLIQDIIRVVGGSAIERTSRRQLDAWEPDWYQQRKTSKLVHYTFDERSPTEFYVYPPAAAGTTVEASIVRLPDPFEKDSDIPLGLEYMDPLASYVVHRALAKDSEYSNNQVAALFYEQFNNALGLQNQAQQAVSANQGET